MPSPEQSEGVRREEQERTPYYQASRISGERVAGKAYAKAQHIIFTAACNLSAYRFQLDRIWHVAVIGEQLDEAIQKQIQKILGAGELVVLLLLHIL